MRALALVATLVLAGCPRLKAPERGYEVVFKKTGDVRPAVERRLAQLSVKARLSEDETHLTVRLPGREASAAGEVVQLLSVPAKLEFCAELARPRAFCDVEADAGVDIDRDESGSCTLVGDNAESLIAAARTHLTKGRVLVGLDDSQRRLRTFVAEEECLVPRMLEAEPSHDSGGPRSIQIVLDAPSASGLAQLTAKQLRKRILLVLDDRVMSAPTVMEAIVSGRTMITFGAGTTDDELTRLSRAWAGGVMEGTLVKEREGHYGPPALGKE